MGGPRRPNRPVTAAVNLPVTRTQVATYTCPSDSNTASMSALLNGVTFHNYVANYGNTNMLMITPLGTDTAGNPNRYGGAPFSWTWFQHGVTLDAKGIKLADVWDGTSNTLLFSETVQGKSGDLRVAWMAVGVALRDLHHAEYGGAGHAECNQFVRHDRSGQPALHAATTLFHEYVAARAGIQAASTRRSATDRSAGRTPSTSTRGGGWEPFEARRCWGSSKATCATGMVEEDGDAAVVPRRESPRLSGGAGRYGVDEGWSARRDVHHPGPAKRLQEQRRTETVFFCF